MAQYTRRDFRRIGAAVAAGIGLSQSAAESRFDADGKGAESLAQHALIV